MRWKLNATTQTRTTTAIWNAENSNTKSIDANKCGNSKHNAMVFKRSENVQTTYKRIQTASKWRTRIKNQKRQSKSINCVNSVSHISYDLNAAHQNPNADNRNSAIENGKPKRTDSKTHQKWIQNADLKLYINTRMSVEALEFSPEILLLLFSSANTTWFSEKSCSRIFHHLLLNRNKLLIATSINILSPPKHRRSRSSRHHCCVVAPLITGCKAASNTQRGKRGVESNDTLDPKCGKVTRKIEREVKRLSPKSTPSSPSQ